MRIAGVGCTWIVAFSALISSMQPSVLPMVRIESVVPFLTLTFGASLLAAPFLVLLGLLAFGVGLWSLYRGNASDAMFIAAFCFAMLATLLAQDVAAFFLSWEATALLSAVLVGRRCGDPRVRRATLLYLLMGQAGALCILTAFAMLATASGGASFSAIAAAAPTLPGGVRNAAFVLALIGFGSKAGLVPLHVWLPRAHPVAPANASALLSGVMLKVALYGLLLVVFNLAGPGSSLWGIALLGAGAISVLLGVLYAVVDRDMKRVFAYSSIENVGIIVMAIGVAQIARANANAPLEAAALFAAFFHTIAHGLFKGLLFLGAGTVHEIEHTTDMERLGGLAERLRWSAPSFLIGCAAVSALPPLSGFVSEWATFQTLIAAAQARTDASTTVVAIAALAVLALASGLAAACFAKAFGIAFLGGPRSVNTSDTVPFVERFDASNAALALLASACVVLGFAPKLAWDPLAVVVSHVAGTSFAFPTLARLPTVLAILPILGVIAASIANRACGVRYVPTWTCGSQVTSSNQYTATAFSKPLRTIFAFIFHPVREEKIIQGTSAWFPRQISYQTKSRYIVDEGARGLLAMLFRFARGTRIVQSGSLRLYLLYIVAAAAAATAAAR